MAAARPYVSWKWTARSPGERRCEDEKHASNRAWTDAGVATTVWVWVLVWVWVWVRG